jgi:RAD54-like protein 2
VCYRRSHSVLQYSLPPKDEYVLLIRLSPIQRKLYNEFIHMIEDQSVAMWASKNPIKAFAVCCKVCNITASVFRFGEVFNLFILP